ncbi:hypothetical protein [Azonexus hydrophilus]|uniref:Penicillin-binding protein activator LpoB n=1 Tax=Azonexus hydrophilus TaxID=418702 RepID=A0ABZ2XM00_9RHOO
MSIRRILSTLAILATLTGCSTINRGPAPNLERGASWAVLPFANHTETPMAGSRAEAIAGAILQRKLLTIVPLPASETSESLFDPNERARLDAAMKSATEAGVKYALAGSVEEWRYKVGVDGEPVVGVSLRIIDVSTNKILWAGSGGKSGWPREALSAVAQQLLSDLMKTGLANAN